MRRQIAALLVISAASGCGATRPASPVATTSPNEIAPPFTSTGWWFDDRPADGRDDEERLDDAVLQYVLESPDTSSSRLYGTHGERRVYVKNDRKYVPRLPEGWTPGESLNDETKARERPALMGVAIEHSPEQTMNAVAKPLFGDGRPVSVSTFNAGGTINGGFMGYTSIGLVARRAKGGWEVRYALIAS